MSEKLRIVNERITMLDNNIKQLEERLGRVADMMNDGNIAFVNRELWAIKENIREKQEELKAEYELKDELEAESNLVKK